MEAEVILQSPAQGSAATQQAPAPQAASHTKLSQWHATAICGNDITSSCLYVAALCTASAGVLSPIALLMVAAILFLFRKIYAEVVDALPLNGGAYNSLLNSTSKFKASIAACMTILSYIATAVISAKVAMEYAHSQLQFIPVLPATIVILVVFAILTVVGIGESAKVALGIFLFHLATLVIFCGVCGIVLLSRGTELFTANWEMPSGQDLGTALFFGFSAALLGISGFESSSNFVEEQAPGVFVKTLRNMWVAVSVFNPLIAFLALGLLPLATITADENIDYLLINMAQKGTGQSWLAVVVAVDATLVLCGAVLTSFVGVTGLVKRMTLDRCLPQLLLKENRRKTNHRIVIAFFLLCTSILLITKGNLKALGGIYTISFLGVMSLFAIGNILLKVNRAKLPRRYRAGWLTVLIALAATASGMVGNILMKPENFYTFLVYFVPTVLVVVIMFQRTRILRGFLYVLNRITTRIDQISDSLNRGIERKIEEINSQGIIFFTKGDSAANLNRAMLYVRDNELAKIITIVHIYQQEEDIPPRLRSDLEYLDHIYPEVKIDLKLIRGRFGPALIQQLSTQFNVPTNYMFIGAPGEKFPHNLAELGGVRLIL